MDIEGKPVENKLGVMPMRRLVITMSIPLMLSLLVQSLYNIVDSIFVARLSEQALTATTLVYPVQILMIALAVGTGVGINALISQLLGRGQTQQVGYTAVTGIILSLVSSAVFVLCALLFSDFIVAWLTADITIAPLCKTYLTICMMFCGGTFIETMGQRFLQASGKTELSMISLIAGAITNIILDPIMIFGYFGMQAMGIRGAAIATVIGQWVGAAVALTLNYFLNPEVQMKFRGFRLEWKTVTAVYRVGLPTIITQALGSVMNFAMNAILLTYSGTAVAFFGVYYKLQNFLLMPMNGLGQAAIPIVGYNYGAKNMRRIEENIRITLTGGLGMALLATALFLAFPRRLLSLFNASVDMLAVGVPAIRIICGTFSFATVTMILGYCASGLGNGIINMTGTGLRQVVLLIPAVYILLKYAGIEYVWYAMWFSETLAAMSSVMMFRKELKHTRLLCLSE